MEVDLPTITGARCRPPPSPPPLLRGNGKRFKKEELLGVKRRSFALFCDDENDDDVAKRQRVLDTSLADHIANCENLQELRALHPGIGPFEAEFRAREDFLLARQHAARQEFSLAKQCLINAMRLHFDEEILELFCHCCFALKQSETALAVLNQLEGTAGATAYSSPLHTRLKSRALLNLGTPATLDSLESRELMEILHSLPTTITPERIQRGLEIAPECIQLLQLELEHCLGEVSQEYRQQQEGGGNAAQFGMLLFDRLDFANAYKFLATVLKEESELALVSRLASARRSTLEELERDAAIQRVLTARPRFHSNWLVAKAHALLSSSSEPEQRQRGEDALSLLRRAVQVDANNTSALHALARHLHRKLKRTEEARALLPPAEADDILGLQTLYQVLGLITRDASTAEIRKAYKKLALLYHPDKMTPQQLREGGEDMFARISQAHSMLCDEQRRREYDVTLFKI